MSRGPTRYGAILAIIGSFVLWGTTARLLVIIGWCVLWGSIVVVNLPEYDHRLILVLPVTLSIGAYVVQLGRRLGLKHAEARSAADTRRAVVYLSSFEENRVLRFVRFLLTMARRPWGTPHTLEEKVISVMKRVGPVVALSRTGEKLPALGAARICTDAHTWEDKARTSISAARAVVFGPGITGLFWAEVALARELSRPDRLIFWFFRSTYQEFRREAISRAALPAALPEAARRVRFLYFQSDWNPVFVERSVLKYSLQLFFFGENSYLLWLLHDYLAPFDPRLPTRAELLSERLIETMALAGFNGYLIWLLYPYVRP